MTRVIRLHCLLIFAWTCLLYEHGLIRSNKVIPGVSLKGAVLKSSALKPHVQPTESGRLGSLQIGHNFRILSHAGNATLATEVYNGTLAYNHDYQSDQAFEVFQERLKKLPLSVQCGDDGMTLKVPGNRVSHLLVDRAGALPVPVSRLPSHCGFSVRRARRDVMLAASYNGCHVIQQGGSYILPLHVFGIPVTMSCPVGSTSPPTVSCGPSSMVVKLEGAVAEHVLVKVKGSWVPLLEVCELCGYNVGYDNGHLLIAVPFTTTCVQPEDSSPTVRLISPAGEMTLVCPSITTAAPLPYLPFPLYPFYPFQWPKVPRIAPVTTTAAPTALPFLYPFNPYYQMPYLKGYAEMPVQIIPKPTTAAPHYQNQFYQQWLRGFPFIPKPTTAAPQYQNQFYQQWLRGFPALPELAPKPTAATPLTQFYPNWFPKWPYVKGYTLSNPTPSPTTQADYTVFPRSYTLPGFLKGQFILAPKLRSRHVPSVPTDLGSGMQSP